MSGNVVRSEMNTAELSKWRDLTPDEARWENAIKTTLMAVGVILLLGAVLGCGMTANGSLAPFAPYDDAGVMNYFTFFWVTVAGTIPLVTGICYDAESSKYPNNPTSWREPDVALNNLRSQATAADLVRHVGYNGKRTLNLAQLVRTQQLSTEQVEAIDKILTNYASIYSAEHERQCQVIYNRYGVTVEQIDPDKSQFNHDKPGDKEDVRRLKREKQESAAKFAACDAAWNQLRVTLLGVAAPKGAAGAAPKPPQVAGEHEQL